MKREKTVCDRIRTVLRCMVLCGMLLVVGCHTGESTAENVSGIQTEAEQAEKSGKEESGKAETEGRAGKSGEEESGKAETEGRAGKSGKEESGKAETEGRAGKAGEEESGKTETEGRAGKSGKEESGKAETEGRAGKPSEEQSGKAGIYADSKNADHKVSEVESNDAAKENGTEKQHELGKESGQMQESGNRALKFSQGGALHVEKTQLMDSEGIPIQLRGISTHGLAWFPGYVNQKFFSQLSNEWNVNVVRLAMYTAGNGGYCTDGNKKELKQLVRSGIEYATQADLYVIVDWHILSDGNPNTYKEEARQFFKEISEEFADHENIIYEICNEPNGNVSWAEIKSYAEEIIPVIRANDADAVIIVGTPTWSQDVDQAAADPITEYDNLMYTLHFYAATHTDWLRERMVKALNAGLPVFVSEFGTCDASGDGGIDKEQSEAWIEKLDAYGVSYVAWNLSNKGETSAIFQSGCSKTSDFTTEDLSENGKWIYEMLLGEHGTTESGSSAGIEKTGDATGKKTESGSSEGIKKTGDAEGKKTESESSTGIEKTGDVAGKKTESGSSEGVEKTGDTGKKIVSGSRDGKIEYTAEVSNSWESEGKYFYQYRITLKNISKEEISDWKLTLTFSEAIQLSDGWNGNYTAAEKKLEITAKDYNSKIAAGGEITDIGFIVSGSEESELIGE